MSRVFEWESVISHHIITYPTKTMTATTNDAEIKGVDAFKCMWNCICLIQGIFHDWLTLLIVWIKVDNCMSAYQTPTTPTPHTHTQNSSFSESQRSASVNTHVTSAQQQRYTLDPQWNMYILHTWSFQTDGKWGRKKRTKLELWGWGDDAKERTAGDKKDQNIKKRREEGVQSFYE